MADIFTSDDNSTPLTPEEREGLKPKWITLRRELNEFETRNILDAEMWLATHKQQDVLNDTFPNLEIAVRLHHRLVLIHPFPNGNGRISRLMADLLMQQLGEPRLYWGDASLNDITDLRKKYIDALHAADSEDYTELIKFVTT